MTRLQAERDEEKARCPFRFLEGGGATFVAILGDRQRGRLAVIDVEVARPR